MRRVSFVIWLLIAIAHALPSQNNDGSQPRPHRRKSGKWTAASTAGSDKLARQAMRKLETYERTHFPDSTCTLKTAYRRKEWDALMPCEKKDYIRAVRCLQTKPDLSGHLVPGARNRYDDFVGTHVNQTLFIHNTGNFLTWHRYFVYTYERALREECGYRGYQPYVNWGRYSEDIFGAPLFDGTETSISGNGAYVPHENIYLPGPDANNSLVTFHASEGGGCIQNGPFKDYKAHLGPRGLVGINTTVPNPRKDGLGYNPRCIKRDLSPDAAKSAADHWSTKLLTKNTEIGAFQTELQGLFFVNKSEAGVHAAGHYMIAGDPGGDFFTSPGDPWFWLHHAQIDRTYWIWQNLGLPDKKRFETIDGTITMLNNPPSRNATLNDVIELGVNDQFKGIEIRHALSTMAGPFCYAYE